MAQSIRPLVPIGLIIMIFAAFGGATFVGYAQAQATATPSIYLPLVVNRYPPLGVFGVEMTSVSVGRGLDSLTAPDTSWIRRNGLLWRDVEPVDGAGYNWSAPSVQALEQEMIAASQRGLRLILIVRGSPRWATAPYQSDCAPINAAKYQRFGAFMAAAVARYSRAPFNVQYWEIGNEPDAPVAGDNVYGCWGQPSDPYYGGQAYGEMLKIVYPAMKAAQGNVQVLNGGLLLDTPYNAQTGSGKSARFLEGMFVAGAGAAFDILSFHSYCYANGSPDGTNTINTSCATDWKVSYLRNLMSAYRVAQKPLFNTEGALLCYAATASCREDQANFVGRLYARAMRDGLVGLSWYVFDSDGFRNTALVEPGNPAVGRTSYAAYRYAAAMFGGADYLGPLTGQPAGVEGYRFRKAGDTITIVWSNTPQAITIPVAGTASVTCTQRDGTPVACSNTGGLVALTALPNPTYMITR